MTFRIGLTLWSLGRTYSFQDLKKQLELAKDIGVEGVQLWAVDYSADAPCLLDPDRCDEKCRGEVKEIIHSYGLEISGFCAQLSGAKRIGGLDDPEGLEWRIEKTKKVLELASEFGAPIVTAHPGLIPDDPNCLGYRIIKDSISKIAKYAEDLNACFAIETGIEPTRTLRTFLEDIGSEGLGVNFDPANLLRYGVEEIIRGVRELGEWIVHTHAKDHNPETGRATVGEGLVPWSRYLKELQGQGYDGWLALEDETGVDVLNSLMKGRDFLLSLISGL